MASFWLKGRRRLYAQLLIQIAPRSGIKDDTQKEIKVETKAEDKAVENFHEVEPWIGKTWPGQRGPHENYLRWIAGFIWETTVATNPSVSQ